MQKTLPDVLSLNVLCAEFNSSIVQFCVHYFTCMFVSLTSFFYPVKNLKHNSLDKKVHIDNDVDDKDGAEVPSKNLKQVHNVDYSSQKSNRSIQDN